MAVELLPDDLVQEILPLLPPPPPPSSRGGRPPVDSIKALNGIMFILRTGCQFQRLPTKAFGVSGSSCWRRLRDWTELGIWPRLHQKLLDRLGQLNGVDLGHVVVDSQSVRAVKGGRTRGRTRRIAANPAPNAMS
jgi:transposase